MADKILFCGECKKCVANKDIYLAQTVQELGAVRKELATANEQLASLRKGIQDVWELSCKRDINIDELCRKISDIH